MPNYKYWDSIFSNTEDSKLGWYEKDLSKTFELINQIPRIKNQFVFLSGAGTSTLVEQLILKGAKLIINDISMAALDKIKTRLEDQEADIYWFCQDISHPFQQTIPPIDIWIDRAVLHFLLDEITITTYFKNIKTKLKIGGYAIFAEFSKTGATQCAGLPLHRYSIDELSKRLGEEFKLISSFEHIYINPRDESRPYIYGLYQRIS